MTFRASIKALKCFFCIYLYIMQANKRNIQTYGRKFGKRSEKKQRQGAQRSYANGEFGSRGNLLMSCYNAWYSLSDLREEIRRNEEFVFGDQWSDKVFDKETGKFSTERKLIQDLGMNPSQYNIIRSIIRSIYGVWSSNKTLPTCVAQKEENQYESEVLTATLHALYRKQELRKLTGAQLVQLIITGIAVMRSSYVSRNGDRDVENDSVDLFSFFIDNTMKDPRYKDCSLVGCFYDLTREEVVSQFARGDKKRAEQIRNLYRGNREERIMQSVQTFTEERLEKDFFVPSMEAYGLCRVIEVWKKESAECYEVHDRLNGTFRYDFESTEAELRAERNRMRKEQAALGIAEEDMLLIEWEWCISDFWKYYYLTPSGEVLDEGVSPFWHESHPFTFELHEFFIGKIKPFIKDLIDANKQINKLSAISELLVKHSAKNLMLMPVEQIANEDGYGVDYIEKKLTSFDAVIPYKSKPGMAPPNFISTVGQSFTPLNVVNMYLKLSEQTSGVYGALQGQQPTSGTPAQMYAQQSQNSAVSLSGLFDAINSFCIRRDKMNVQLMQQYYEDRRYIYDKGTGKRLIYERDKVKNLDFEISISENTDTPAYRLMVNDILFQLKQFDANNSLDFRGMLEVMNLPFKDKLLDYINKREKEMRQAQEAGMPYQPQEMPQDVQNELAKLQFAPEVQEEFLKLPEDVKQGLI